MLGGDRGEDLGLDRRGGPEEKLPDLQVDRAPVPPLAADSSPESPQAAAADAESEDEARRRGCSRGFGSSEDIS